jgi:hypothetical protein
VPPHAQSLVANSLALFNVAIIADAVESGFAIHRDRGFGIRGVTKTNLI